MARQPHAAWAVGVADTYIAGAFTLNGSSDPTMVSGSGFTVTRNTAGVFDVELSEQWPAHQAIVVSLENPNLLNYDVYTRSVDVGGAKQFQVVTVSGSPSGAADQTATDAGSSSGLRINMVAVVKQFKTI